MAGMCPCCSSKLKRVIRQGFAVYRCESCHGYLITSERLQTIKCLPTAPVKELKQEVLSESREDTKAPLRCPECHHRMRKKMLKAPASFQLDICDHCRMVWLDGGELARLQLAHRASQQGQETAELRRRRQEMTPEEKAALDKKLASLKESPNEKDESDVLLDVASVVLSFASGFRFPFL